MPTNPLTTRPRHHIYLYDCICEADLLEDEDWIWLDHIYNTQQEFAGFKWHGPDIGDLAEQYERQANEMHGRGCTLEETLIHIASLENTRLQELDQATSSTPTTAPSPKPPKPKRPPGQTHMNFLDAHKIVHDYALSLSYKPDPKAMLFRPKSFLKNTPDDIIDAYKLFYGHMVLFHTRTQEEYEQYEASRKFLRYFVDDIIYHDVIYYNQILAKNPLAKLFDKRQVEEAQQKINNYTNKLTKIINKEPYRNKEVETYFIKIQEQANITRQLSNNKEVNVITLINDYCKSVYQLANIPMREHDIDYFYSFDALRTLCKDPQNAKFYSNYLDYINTSN